jgi:carbonic anhydrase/acetyltransferase-like protein (isoleucine patch superfamily)
MPNSQIKNRCTIGNNSIVGNHSIIGSNTFTRNNASIGNNVTIGSDVSISYGTSIRDAAFICNGSSIGDYSSIKENTKLNKNLYIVGSLGPVSAVTYTGNRTLSIGCKNYNIDELIKNFKEAGKLEGLNDQQVNEYREYLLIIDKFSKL